MSQWRQKCTSRSQVPLIKLNYGWNSNSPPIGLLWVLHESPMR
jgi:hypothetical protein